MWLDDRATKNKNLVQKGCVRQGKRGLDQCKKVHQISFGTCLERGEAWGMVASDKAIACII